ncbi:uncharacterized protein LY89DRAFT_734109 [Mollisia scopiformis]|uniref:Uncharacterized protein n=1 Tax=Mollisia scopiformis TaxID=149040 RepID=A0A194XAC9_MOLSC|nr:uncharacterized protein LY89DRAFT_734109 [Mollisia scopiformis]KUJ17121.1 hypothetical protein LY89DRAFT_734109 [Mollisia scopiformis]
MKNVISIAIAMLSLSVVTLAYVGPCYNAADPDAGVGNYCQCEDGCYAPGTGANDCAPPGVALGFCPY